MDTDKLVVVVGPTASGKSKLAMELAEKYNGEIICADSRTIYKGMDIGTAKPTLYEQKRVKHHLLDVVTPDDTFTAADFKEAALKAIKEISFRGKTPFLVGGSGLYIDSVIYDFDFAPKSDTRQRQQLNALPVEDLQGIIRTRNLQMPTNYKNKRHLVRVIETNGQKTSPKKLKPNTLVIGLKVPKDDLSSRIKSRVEQMVDDGLVKEAEDLGKRYGWGSEPMKSIGYQEWQDYFAGKQSLQDTTGKIVVASNKLAKRQMTWFRRNKNIVWIQDLQDARNLVDGFVA